MQNIINLEDISPNVLDLKE